MKRIALIGRPNVGKSSLFNALLGHRRAIVYDEPGTTMDLIIESVDWGKLQLMDSQGIFGEGDEVVLAKALEEADAYLFVVDAHVGLTPFDQWIGQLISRQGKPTLLVLNKADGKGFYTEDDFARLGLEETVLSSASHRRGIDLIKEWCLTQVNQELAPHHEKERPIKMALVGRPNSGKSTLMNKLCRKKVSRVSPEPLTTRDPVSFEMEQGGHYIRLVDTAGIRRPRTKKGSIEEFSISAATRTIRASDVVCLLINCNEPITDQDMRLLSLLEREGKPVLVLLNFWDCLNGEQRAHFVKESDFAAYLKNFQTLPISGKTGWQIHKLIPMVVKTAQTSTIRVKTSDLNKFVENVIARNPPPAAGFGNFNILYGSQIKTQPPTFVFFMNRKGNLPDSYRKYLEGKIKQRLGFKGQTVRIFFRAREHRANPG